MVDYLGKEITVGQQIVYPGRRGSSLWMNRACVTGFTEQHGWAGPRSVIDVQLPNGRRTQITDASRVVVVR